MSYQLTLPGGSSRRPETQTPDSLAYLAYLANQADQTDQENEAAKAAQRRSVVALPGGVTKPIDPKEDPRVTAFLAGQQRMSQNTLLDSSPSRKKALLDANTAAFFGRNPDLDPRVQAALAAQTVKVKDKSVPAEKGVQDVLRVLTTPDSALGPSAALTKIAMRESYRKVKDQLTPEMRVKYDLDRLEKSGMFDEEPSALKKGIGAIVSAPGISHGLDLLGRVGSTVPAAVRQAGIALEELTGAPGHENESISWGQFQKDIKEHLTPGDLYTQSLKHRAAASGGTASPFGVDALGLTLDAAGNATYNSSTGHAAATAVGVVGGVGLDPLTYVSLGTPALAEAGLKTLEREGLAATANLIRKGGMKALSEVELSEVRAVLTATKNLNAKNVMKYGEDAVTKVQMGQMAEAGQQGIKVTGKTVIPFSTSARIAEARAASRLADPLSNIKDNIDDVIKRVHEAPASAGAADGFETVVDKQIPAEAGTHVISDGAGGATIGIRNAAGKLEGYLTTTKDTISNLENVSGREGVGQELLRTAEDHGLDVPQLLANSTFTADGRDAAVKYATDGSLSGRLDTATTYRRTSSGGAAPARLFRERDGEYLLKDGEFIIEPLSPPRGLAAQAGAGDKAGIHTANGGMDVGTVVGRENGGILLLQPATGDILKTKIGDHVPGVFGRLEEIRPDGTWVIRGDRSLFKKTREAALAGLPPGLGRTLKNAFDENGGFTSTIDGTAPTSGYTVAVDNELTKKIPLEDFKASDITDYAAEHANLLAKPGTHLGGWQEGGFAWLDITEVVADRAEAEAAGVARNQKAIYDVVNGVEIPIGGTGAPGPVGAAAAPRAAEAALGASALKGGTPAPGAEAHLGGVPLKPNLRDKIPGIQGVRDALSPRASVDAAARAGRVPAGSAESLSDLMSRWRARLGNDLNDKKARFHSVDNRLREDLGREDAARVLSDAFDVPAGEGSKAQSVADALRADGKLQAAAAIETMDKLRTEIHSIGAKLDQGSLDLGSAGVDSQMPLVLAEQGKKALELQPNLLEAFGVERQAENLSRGFDFSEKVGHVTLTIEDPRVAKGLAEKGSVIEIPLNRPVKEVNSATAAALTDETKRALGIAEGDSVKVFEENALTAYSYRNRTSQTVAIEQDMMDQAEKLGLVHRGTIPASSSGVDQVAYDLWKRKVPKNYVEVKGWTTPGEVTFADPSVAKDLSKVRALLRNDEELKKFKSVVDQASAMWVRQVLSPVTKGVGQQMRNLQSNIINATFGGLTLDGQREAIRLQVGALRQVGNLMKTEGLTFEESVAKLGLSNRDAALLRYLREDDILNTGLYRTLDWGDTTGDKLGANLKDKIKNRISPLSSNNVLVAPGRLVNTLIEDNGRMALYISVFDKTGSREAATAAVKKYMFDYADLTTFESHVLKNFNAFYTYMRKNTALQLRVFAEQPMLPLTVLKAKQALASGNNDLLKPGETKERGLFQAGGALQSIIGGKGVVGIDDPVTAAIRTVDPFIQGAYYTLNGISGGKLTANLPPAERPTGAAVAKGFIGLTAGAPAAALTTIAEIALKKDLRSDRDLLETGTWQKLVSAVAPVWTQASTVKGMASGDLPLRTNLLRMFAGISAYNREGDAAHRSLNYAMLKELDETIKLLEAEGVSVPTLSDLQTAGLIPKASELSKPRTVQLTPDQKKAEARKKLGITK